MTEKVFHYFFICALATTFLFLGWYLGFSAKHSTLVLLLFLGVVFLTLNTKISLQAKYKCLIIIGTFLIGYLIAQTNIANSSLWLEQSFSQVRSILDKPDSSPTTPSDTKSIAKLGEFYRLATDFQLPVIFSTRAPNKTYLVEENEILELPHDGHPILAEDDFIVYYTGKENVKSSTGSEQIIKKDILGKENVWEIELDGRGPYAHHWGAQYKEKLYIPGRSFINLPNETSKAIGGNYGRCKSKNAYAESIIILDSQNGKMIKEVPILPLLVDIAGIPYMDFLTCNDPIHLNDIQIIKTKKQADYFPGGRVGDLLISLREIHSIALLDQDSYQIKWHVFGKFEKQHSPRITDRGTILVFDNKGSDPSSGESRIVEVDIASGETVGVYESSESDPFFHSDIRGKIQIFRNRIFVYEQSTSKKPMEEKFAYMFELICPEKYISNSCERRDIYKTKEYNFGEVLPSIP